MVIRNPSTTQWWNTMNEELFGRGYKEGYRKESEMELRSLKTNIREVVIIAILVKPT